MPILMSLLLAAATADAAPAPPPCPATPVALPADLAGWAKPAPLKAATSEAGLAGAALTFGRSVDLALAGTPDVAYVLRPDRPGGSVSHGGMAQIVVETAGVYRVAIDSAAWIDVVAAGKSLESVSHGHGPDCSGIRKMVDFRLEPGRYVLQIAGNGAPKVHVLVTRLTVA